MLPEEILKQVDTFDPTLSNEMIEMILQLFESRKVNHYEGAMTLITILGNTLGEMVKAAEVKGGAKGFNEGHALANQFVKSLEVLICTVHGGGEENKIVH